jgi:hypothetical protein
VVREMMQPIKPPPPAGRFKQRVVVEGNPASGGTDQLCRKGGRNLTTAARSRTELGMKAWECCSICPRLQSVLGAPMCLFCAPPSSKALWLCTAKIASAQTCGRLLRVDTNAHITH